MPNLFSAVLGSDVGMCMCPDVRVESECHPCHLAAFTRQLVYHLQFGYALHVEAEDVVVQPEVDLPVALSHAGIYDPVVGESRLYRRLYLTAADAVSPQACSPDDPQQLRVGIRLHRIVHHEPLVLPCLGIDSLQRTSEHVGVIPVERCLYPLEPVDRKMSFSHVRPI